MNTGKEYKNQPPKDITNAIWGACFDYNDFDTVVDGQPIRDRIYECWQRIHQVMAGWHKADPDGFIKMISEDLT